MKKESKKYKCGFVSIVGRPNVGKSTLLNALVGEKVAIVSKVPQTTRNQVRGVYTDERGQIVFIDTPGFHRAKDKLDRYMNQNSTGAMQDVDCIIYLVDATRRVGDEEGNISGQLKKVKVPLILGLNKVDIKKANIPAYIAHWESVKGESVTEMNNFALIALSGEKSINIEKLIDIIFDFLPEGPLLYPEDTLTDTPQKLTVSDIIREKFFMFMKEEIPHALGVVIEQMRPVKGNTILIKALVYVEREHQKEIVIGKNGDVLKKVGTMARQDLEELLETKVFLEFHVKVQKNWRDNISLLQEIGFDNQ
jgi:GTP-binding protein Era